MLKCIIFYIIRGNYIVDRLKKEGDTLVMIKNHNSIILLIILLIINFTLGCENKRKNVNDTQLKNSSKVTTVEPKRSELNKNSTQQKNTKSNNIEKNELKSEVERIYNERSSALVSGEVSSLKTLFDTSQKHGKLALEHEVKRVKYLNNWANERNITFSKIKSMVRIKHVYPQDNVMKIALEESYKFDYVYNNDDNSPINSFGVGIRHTTSLIKKNKKWVIYNDCYTDCFEDALQNYSNSISTIQITITPINNINRTHQTVSYHKTFYDKQRSVAYADKYCGAAWRNGNNFSYNNKYNDYNGRGGDCTNYISQVLGDKEGGGIPIDGAWTPGSKVWVNANSLKNYLISSGKGSVINVGTFKELTKSSKGLPNVVVKNLQIGDLIAYEKGKGNIDHFAIVTGFDTHGYPLVNSHTTDRYHVPWDLGWGDSKIRFFLIHING